MWRMNRGFPIFSFSIKMTFFSPLLLFYHLKGTSSIRILILFPFHISLWTQNQQTTSCSIITSKMMITLSRSSSLIIKRINTTYSMCPMISYLGLQHLSQTSRRFLGLSYHRSGICLMMIYFGRRSTRICFLRITWVAQSGTLTCINLIHDYIINICHNFTYHHS